MDETFYANVERFSEEGAKLSDDKRYVEALDHFTQALSLLRSRSSKSSQNGDRDALIACLYNVGSCEVALERHAEALATMRALEPLLQNSDEGSVKMTGDSYYLMGFCSQKMGQLKAAVSYLLRAAAAYEKEELKHRKEILEVYNLLARISIEENAVEEEEEERVLLYLDKVIACGKAEAAHFDVAMAYCHKGVRLSRFDHRKGEGRDCLELARVESTKVEGGKKQAVCLSSVGSSYVGLGLLELASSCFHQALRVLREAEKKGRSNQLEEAVLLQNLGAICNQEEKYEDSIPYHSGASKAYAEVGETQSSGICLTNLAFAHTSLKNYSQAEEALREALQKAEESACKELECKASELLGTVFYRQDKHEEALGSFKRALCAAGQVSAFTDGLSNQSVSDRIVTKLTDVLETQQEREQKERLPSSSSSSEKEDESRQEIRTKATVHSSAENMTKDAANRSYEESGESSSVFDGEPASARKPPPPPERPDFQDRIESRSGLTVKDEAMLKSRLEYFKNYESPVRRGGDTHRHSTPGAVGGEQGPQMPELPFSPVVKEGCLAGETRNYEGTPRSSKTTAVVKMPAVREEDAASVSTATTGDVKSSKTCVVL